MRERADRERNRARVFDAHGAHPAKKSGSDQKLSGIAVCLDPEGKARKSS